MKIIKLVLKQIGYNLRALYYTLYWLLKQLYKFKFFRLIKPIKQSKTLAVFGNGPSMKSQLEEYHRKKNEELAVVNSFCNSPFFEKLRPEIYVLMDPAFFEKSEVETDEVNKIKLYEALSRVTWKMVVLVPYTARKYVRDVITNPNLSIVYSYNNEYLGWHWLENKLFAHGLFFPRCQNVLIAAISYGLISNYSRIELYGADHSWTEEICVNEKSELCLIDKHFYDNEAPQMIPWRWMDGSVMKISELMDCLYHMFNGYNILKRYADYLHIEIVNKTQNSFIDAFKKV